MAEPTELVLALAMADTLRAASIAYYHAKEEAFTVDSDTDVDVKAFDPRKFATGFILGCHNSDAADGLIFTIYGDPDFSDATPPDFATNKWVALPNGSKTIAAGVSDAITNTDPWRWILIRVKRETSAQDAIANFYIIGR